MIGQAARQENLELCPVLTMLLNILWLFSEKKVSLFKINLQKRKCESKPWKCEYGTNRSDVERQARVKDEAFPFTFTNRAQALNQKSIHQRTFMDFNKHKRERKKLFFMWFFFFLFKSA